MATVYGFCARWKKDGVLDGLVDWGARRKRHILTDTLGLLIAVVVTAAGVQDRDGAVVLVRTGWARAALGIIIQIVRRCDTSAGPTGPSAPAYLASPSSSAGIGKVTRGGV